MPLQTAAAIILCLITGMLIWFVDTQEDVAVISPSPSPTFQPSPTLTPTPSPTVVLSTSPVSSNARVEYVRSQLASTETGVTVFNSLLADTRLVRYPVKTVAYRAPNWKPIEDKLYSEAWLQKGADYIKANQAIFDKMESDYGIKKEVLTGLIAMETDFGQNAGTYPVFNALYSRMMNWPETTWKAQADQLVALSKHCAQSNIDCYTIKGSYAGAFGIVQFMPNSLLAYGVDGDGSGVIDLSKPIDAIPSAANYLKLHGWDTDQHRALARYYGSSVGYPDIVLKYASLLENRSVN